MAAKKTDKLPAPKTVLDLQDLTRRVGPAGSVWVRTGSNFDHPGFDVTSIAIVISGPEGGRSITLQSYNGSVGRAAARLETLETAGSPIKGEVGQYLAKLERRGYRVVPLVDATEPAAKKPIRARKAAAPVKSTPALTRPDRRKSK